MTSCSSPEENSLGTAACHSILLVHLFYCISCRVIHCSIFASCSWSGIIHHPNHWNIGPYGLGVNYEAMRKVIIFAETAILCYDSLRHPSFLIWKNEREKATGPVFVLWIGVEGRKHNQWKCTQHTQDWLVFFLFILNFRCDFLLTC